MNLENLETSKNESSVPQAATLRVGMEEMIGAGFYTCICTVSNRICVRAVGIFHHNGQFLLDCKKARQPISLEIALGCTSACLVAVSKSN